MDIVYILDMSSNVSETKETLFFAAFCLYIVDWTKLYTEDSKSAASFYTIKRYNKFH